MKQKSTSAAVAAIVASLSASLAPVPAKSTTLPTTVMESKAHVGVSAALTFELPSGQIFLPLEEATDYLNGINSNQRSLLSAIIQKRQLKGKGALLMANLVQTKRICEDALKQHARVKEAIKIVIAPDNLAKMHPDSLELRVQHRDALIRFGRAVAQSEFLARDTLNAIERSRPPSKTISLSDMPSDEDVRAMITAEHKNLGISAPGFS
ncbi:iron-sulfur cluster assembly scaffold protein SufA [Buttiauxella izardii]|uniref:Iron-sulfur cluster assembly scaffold protein SufA n=1 Tax=Buttiauxella izardii TaxID=82991 RepID=A0A3A5JYV9_9ENTR|nr:iron-sulfur cluster assembly scaffold protein SufA [Buttiauxella izardii]RJT27335.1 iron-sulfur cluster assembly scaffold protein SufA [Buttiauxella izardii]